MIERVRLYSNENFPIAMVEHLRSLDCDVLTSYDAEQANQGIPDDEVLRFATAQNRAVITFNRDDFVALHRGSEHHAGIIGEHLSFAFIVRASPLAIGTIRERGRSHYNKKNAFCQTEMLPIIVCKDDRDYLGQVTILYAYLQEIDLLDNRLIRIKKQNQPGLSHPVFVVQEYAR